MKYTFGIITTGNKSMIHKAILSIYSQNIPEFEILIVGGPSEWGEFAGHDWCENGTVRHIQFNESIKNSWITKKKNIITNNAKYDNIVYMHDYICLMPGWYDGFQAIGHKFDICMTKMLRPNGSRYRDWSLLYMSVDGLGVKRHHYLLPYDVTDLSKFMYISGAYWVAKKHVMTDFPLNESLGWGQGEDCEWSQRIKIKHEFTMNALSSVILQKDKDPIFHDALPCDIDLLRKLL